MKVSDFEPEAMALCVCERLELRAGKNSVEFDPVKGVARDAANSKMAKGRKGCIGCDMAVAGQPQRAHAIARQTIERGDAREGIEVKLIRSEVGQ